MKIYIKTKTKAKKELVEKIDQAHYLVFVKELPIKGRANEAIIELLADYFKIKKADVNIVAGHKGKQKIVEVNLN